MAEKDVAVLTPEFARDLLAMRRAWKAGTLDPSRMPPPKKLIQPSQQRWLPVKNIESSKTIPPYGVVQLVDAVPEPHGEEGFYLTVQSMDEDGTGIYMFAGGEEIPYNGYGVATVDTPAWARYEDEGSSDLPVVGSPLAISQAEDFSLEVWESTGFNRRTEFVAWSTGDNRDDGFGRVLVERDVPSAFGGFYELSDLTYTSMPKDLDFGLMFHPRAGVASAGSPSGSELEIKYPGCYMVFIHINARLDMGQDVSIRLKVNGSTPDSGSIRTGSKAPSADSGVTLSGTAHSLSVGGIVWCDAGDVLSVTIDSIGASVTLNDNGGLWVTRLR